MAPHIVETQIPIITPIQVTTAAVEDMIAIVMVVDIEAAVAVDMVAEKVMNHRSNREAVLDDTKDTVTLTDIRLNDPMSFINVNFIR